jgi:hypothetical protein
VAGGGSVDRNLALARVMLSFLAGFTKLAEDKPVEPYEKGKNAVVEGGDAKVRFFVWDADSNLLAMSGLASYPTEKEARKAIASLKEVMASAKVATQKAEK